MRSSPPAKSGFRQRPSSGWPRVDRRAPAGPRRFLFRWTTSWVARRHPSWLSRRETSRLSWPRSQSISLLPDCGDASRTPSLHEFPETRHHNSPVFRVWVIALSINRSRKAVICLGATCSCSAIYRITCVLVIFGAADFALAEVLKGAVFFATVFVAAAFFVANRSLIKLLLSVRTSGVRACWVPSSLFRSSLNSSSPLVYEGPLVQTLPEPLRSESSSAPAREAAVNARFRRRSDRRTLPIA